MKILFVVSEAFPFVKTGGLGDVAYALPHALKKMGHDVRVVLPKYSSISKPIDTELNFIKYDYISMNWRREYSGLFYATYNGVMYYFIDNEKYFKRNGYYGFYDDGERFSFYSKAVLDIICQDEFIPDILHINDWHTAPIALLLKDNMYKNSIITNTKTVFTIHNLKYQGIFPIDMLCDFYGIDNSYLTSDKIEFNGNINFMKMGIVYADKVTTVSPTYAREIKYDYFGEQLEGIIAQYDIIGILNGVDYQLYNPSVDEFIFEKYNIDNASNIKKKNKTMLQSLLGLKIDANIPLIAMVTRLVDHKGIDLVLEVIEEIMQMGVQFIVLGTGDKKYEDKIKCMGSYFPEMFSDNIYFDAQMAARIYASSDMFLMPSLIEPCGIGQLIAMRYGSIPIVRQTGGLMDTITPYNKYEDSGNGFGFQNINAHEMLCTIGSALELYRDNIKWENMIKRSMSTDVSWDHSANQYEMLYKSLK